MGTGAGARAGDYARLALAGIRLANGGAALFAPHFLARRVGVDPEQQPGIIYAFRLFGIRTILIGAQLAFEPPAAHSKTLREAVIIHTSDTITALVTVVRGQLPLRAAVMATLISATNTALALVALGEEG